ncbi:NAD(P)/FAD-dependent oxidoreductase [Kribbella sp. NPDC051620]|uniref:NAD(P)/FAD-dependent oxidoreductase n=1 Tax=Kribbella sp. NPDC051620 TaxID=3364120 RepID=UPI0037B3E6F8
MTAEHVDVAVVGAGPAGLFAGFYAGLRGMRTAFVDSLDEPGGQVSALYPEKLIRDVAGFPAIKGRELIAQLLAQLEPYDPVWRLGSPATVLADNDAGFRLATADGSEILARAVVVTGGVGTFTPRTLGIGDEYVGRGVTYFVKDPAALAGRHLVIVGGGDSAFDWADTLAEVAASVRLVHRRDRFRAHPDTVGRVLADDRVDVHTNSRLVKLAGQPLEAVTIVTADGSARTVPCDHVVAALGFVANLGPIEGWGLTLEDRRIRVDASMRTSRPGVFAAGDICTYPGRVPLIAVGFGEAATAVNHAAAYMDPHAAVFPGHSTDEAGLDQVHSLEPA